MIFKLHRLTVALTILCFCDDVKSFGVNRNPPRIGRVNARAGGSLSTTSLWSSETSVSEKKISIWETLANTLYSDVDLLNDFEGTKSYTNTVSLFRVGFPSLFLAASAKIAYPFVAIALANAIDDAGVFAVVSQDASQYIQNILTTSGLTFSILLGQTYYFMYQVRKHKR
jgi:hypothetical protein